MRPTEASTAARRIRIAASSFLLLGVVSSTLALVYQVMEWGELERGDVAGAVKLLTIFWSPYLGLLLLLLLLGRRAIRAAVLLAGSVLVTLWGLYWHIDILWLRPSVMSQILSPLLITGNQWLGVLASAVLAWLVGILWRPSVRPSQGSDWSDRRDGGGGC